MSKKCKDEENKKCLPCQGDIVRKPKEIPYTKISKQKTKKSSD